MAVTKNLADVIRKKLALDQDLAEAVESERFNANVAAEISEARKQARMTQQELATRTGMHQSAIARLEDADYDGGHSLKTLERIAFALGKRVEVHFVEPYAAERVTTTEEFSIDSSAWSTEPEWDCKITTRFLPPGQYDCRVGTVAPETVHETR